MDINHERLEEIKAEFAYRHQLSAEEVSRMMDNVIIRFPGMTERLELLTKEMARIWRSLKEAFQENCEETLWSENEAIHGWDLKWDTRRRSQVMSNKPKFIVRKIIR